MTPEQAAELLARVSYKPGYQWALQQRAHQHYAILLWQGGLPDSRDATRTVNLIYTHTPLSNVVLGYMSEEDFLLMVREAAAFLEIHEMHEWLRLDGKLLHDPHDPQGLRRGELALGGALYDPHDPANQREPA